MLSNVWLLFLLLFATLVAVAGGICALLDAVNYFEVMNRLPKEPRPVTLVREFFRQKYPQDSISWLHLSATEASRWMVSVNFGSTDPPEFKFFTVDRSTEQVTELGDCSQYTPQTRS